MQEIYVSTDVETDGPCPGINNMLSFGSAAFTLEKELIGTFERNLELIPGCVPDEDTQKFWNRNHLAYLKTRKNLVDPAIAMKEYTDWLYSFKLKPIFVGYPAVFDFKFIDYYAHRFTKVNPFSFSCVDIKSMAWVLLDGRFSDCTKRNMPKSWFDPVEHTHVAIDDAIEQGALFVNMMRQIRDLPKVESIIYVNKRDDQEGNR